LIVDGNGEDSMVPKKNIGNNATGEAIIAFCDL
jgi:hypothetical protein